MVPLLPGGHHQKSSAEHASYLVNNTESVNVGQPWPRPGDDTGNMLLYPFSN